jgi:hypothetical protein
MRLRDHLFAAALLASAFGLAHREIRPPAGTAARDLLRTVARINDAEWASVERGEAIAKVLDADSREIAVVGAVRIAAPSDRLVARYRDIENLKRSAIVLDVGRIGLPPRAADLVAVPFEEYSLDLRDCRPYECRVRLGEAEIARFHREVDWRAMDWRDRSRTIWRDVLAGYAAGYMTTGRRALPVYANKREPLSVSSELAELVQEFGFVGTSSPEFLAYLREFGPNVPSGTEQVLYWTKGDFGVRPILRISHQSLLPSSGSSTVLIATNQVYADHYLDAALSVTMAIDAADVSAGRAFHMIVVSRARTRSLSGFLRALVRSTVQTRTREAMRKILTATKASLEK